jgi:hypothetical protein
MQSLEVLVGEWTVEIVHPALPPISARQRFEPILGGRFILHHVTVDHPDFPDSISVLGPDRSHYFDTRGVTRTYQMSLAGGVWKLWREDPDFWQRFTATIGADGDTITATYEMSHDSGATWQHDFALNYRRVAPG